MSPTPFPLGYNSSNYLYSMLMNQQKIMNTTRQISPGTTQNIANVLKTFMTDNITTDAPRDESTTETEEWGRKIASFCKMIIICPIIVLIVWCFEKIIDKSRRSSSGETTYPLCKKYLACDQPPAYAELSPSYPPCSLNPLNRYNWC